MRAPGVSVVACLGALSIALIVAAVNVSFRAPPGPRHEMHADAGSTTESTDAGSVDIARIEVCHANRPPPRVDDLDLVGRAGMLAHIENWARDLRCPGRTAPLLSVLSRLRVLEGRMVVESDELVDVALREMSFDAPSCAAAMRSAEIVDPVVARECPIGEAIHQGVAWRTYSGLWLVHRRLVALEHSGPWGGAHAELNTAHVRYLLTGLASALHFYGFTLTHLIEHRRMFQAWREQWGKDDDLRSSHLSGSCASLAEHGGPGQTDLDRHYFLLEELSSELRAEPFSDLSRERRDAMLARFPCDSQCRIERLELAEEVDEEMARVCRVARHR